ncbi:MAG: sterol desaturase family protein [Bacteroidia bacterium]|nr:sterol desaturase family protein [Bacteroidia bacterium]
MILNIFITIVTFFVMEAIVCNAHKYIMHGFLCSLHEDHHKKNPSYFLEKNDYFFIIFAVPATLFFGLGTFFSFLFYIGLGILIYGIAYFFVHDIFIHQRVKWLRNTNNFYFRAIRRAHTMHHKHLGEEHGECYGMLLVPFKYFKEEIQQPKSVK